MIIAFDSALKRKMKKASLENPAKPFVWQVVGRELEIFSVAAEMLKFAFEFFLHLFFQLFSLRLARRHGQKKICENI